MLFRLPHAIDALELADRNASIQGELELRCFNRLAGLLSNDEGAVAFNLVFAKQGRLAVIEGHISTTLALQCQRCLEAVEWRVDSDIKLGIVGTVKQTQKLPEGYEPYILADNDKIILKTLIEDELLLCLPDIPKHQAECATPSMANILSNSVPDQYKKENPFSVLADLKNLETQNGSTKK